jgi:N-acetylneuraminic acid mutarotase
MKSFTRFLVILLALCINKLYAQSWTEIESFTEDSRSYAISFVIGEKAYVGTGFSGILNSAFWEFSPALEAWTQKADLEGSPRASAVGFAIEQKGYVGLGIIHWDGNIYTYDFWEYDPVTNIWNAKAKFPGGKREGAIAFSIGSKGYLGTGTDGASFQRTKDLWEYDPSSNTWTKKSDFPGEPRNGAVAFTIGNKGYVGTGFGDVNGQRKDFWEYDPAADSWIQRSDLGGLPRNSAVGFSLGDKGYIGTGTVYDSSCSCGGASNDIWEYDPQADSWNQKINFGGEARRNAVGFSVGDKAYIGLGTGFSDFWEYDPGCIIPASLTTTNIKATTARVNWGAEPTAETYSVRYRKTGTVPWTKTTATTNFKKLAGLSADTQYDWAVKSVCDVVTNLSSDWSAIQNFATKPLRLEGETGEEIRFNVYPNPMAASQAGAALVSFSVEESSTVMIEVFGVTGRKIKTLLNAFVESGDHQLAVTSEYLPAGVYFLKLTSNGNHVIVKLVAE